MNFSDRKRLYTEIDEILTRTRKRGRRKRANKARYQTYENQRPFVFPDADLMLVNPSTANYFRPRLGRMGRKLGSVTVGEVIGNRLG